MRVLAIDTALEACSAAVLDTEHVAMSVHESLPKLRGHAEALMPMIARVMDRAGLDFAALDRIAVTTGPGSFTGLRVGLAAARGLALATGKPAIGLSTLAAYAAPLVAADGTLPVVAAIDARHDRVYVQVFGPGGRTIVPARLASIREALRAAAMGAPRLIASGITNHDGRSDAPLIGGRPLPIGTYELRFAVGDYFAARGVPAADPPFLDMVTIDFGMSGEGHYHVPLLVSPFAYSTYRGS